VTPSHFIVSDVEVGLLLGDRKSKTWEKVPGIVPAGGILVSGNDIYLASARHLRTEHDLNPPPDRIVRYNIQKKTGELISDRTRWPALTPLDDAGLLPELMVWNEERELEIWVRGSTVDVHRERRFAYNLTTKAWRKIPMPDPPFNLARWKPTLKPGFLGYISGRREKLEGAVSPVFSRRSVSATPDPDSTFLLQCKVDETLVASAQHDDNGKYIPFSPANISITDKGWIISESEGRCFWWLPWSDLEAYLAIHPAAAKLIAEYELKSGMTLREKRSP